MDRWGSFHIVITLPEQVKCDVIRRCAIVDGAHSLVNGPEATIFTVDCKQYVADLNA